MNDKRCPQCGYTLKEYYKTGYLGCPECYRQFAAEIIPSLAKIQGGTTHVGKKPVVGRLDRELLKDYRYYLKEKERACLDGRFDDMAEISSILNELTQELTKRGLI